MNLIDIYPHDLSIRIGLCMNFNADLQLHFWNVDHMYKMMTAVCIVRYNGYEYAMTANVCQYNID